MGSQCVIRGQWETPRAGCGSSVTAVVVSVTPWKWEVTSPGRAFFPGSPTSSYKPGGGKGTHA